MNKEKRLLKRFERICSVCGEIGTYFRWIDLNRAIPFPPFYWSPSTWYICKSCYQRIKAMGKNVKIMIEEIQE